MPLTRRYKRLVHKAYDDKFDRAIKESRILNAGADTIPSAYTTLWEPTNIKNIIYEYEGDEKGQFYRPDERYPYRAVIASYQDKLDDLKASWKKRNETRRLMGLPVEKEMTGEVLDKKLELEASLDVSISELDTLKEWLSKYTEKAEESRKDSVLRYGLQCSISLLNGKIDTIDGQRVQYIDNQPVIQDEHSPYNGMLVGDYRKLSSIVEAQRRQKHVEKLKKLQATCKENCLPIPKKLPAESPKVVSRTSLPPWPDFAQNMFEKEERKLVRTK